MHRRGLRAGLCLLLGCSASDPLASDGEGGGEGGEAERRAAIDAYVIGLGTPDAPPDTFVAGAPTRPDPDGPYVCTDREVDETRQYDRIVAFAAHSHALYPGALVAGEAIDTGTFTPIVLDRAPLRFSASLEGVLDGAISGELAEPSLASFRDAMHEILAARVVGHTPANVYAEIDEVHSFEHLALALGVEADWLWGGVEASLAFDSTEVRSRYVIAFTQTYYTVDVDPPGAPSDVLDEGVDLDEVEAAFDGEPPVYVASVSYGRTVLFTVTSELSAAEVGAALDFAYYGAAWVDGSVSLTHEEVLAHTHITAHILGGDGVDAVQAIYGADELRAFIEQGGTYTPESPGAPIAYKLAFLADNSPARWSLTSEYALRACTRRTQNVRVGLSALSVIDDGGDAGDELELYGTIAVVDERGQTHTLWQTDGDHHVTVHAGESWPQDGEIAAATVPVTSEPGASFDLVVDLREDDGFGDDDFGHVVTARPFEDGWRADVSVPLAKGDQHASVRFTLVPVE
jgi:thiol-activated cytolysin